jgi:hypothetical protein
MVAHGRARSSTQILNQFGSDTEDMGSERSGAADRGGLHALAYARQLIGVIVDIDEAGSDLAAIQVRSSVASAAERALAKILRPCT